MPNERITESIFRNKILEDELYLDKKIILEEQQSKSVKINKLLANASKSGNNKGYPEFLISFNELSDFIIVVECKADKRKHESNTGDKYSEYAVDGVKVYSSFLSKEYDVLSIAISGEKDIKVSHFMQLKGTSDIYKNEDLKENHVYKLKEYITAYKKDEIKFSQDYKELLTYSRELNDKLHMLKIPESDRSILISGTLIALNNEAFLRSYKYQKPKDLANNLTTTIRSHLETLQKSNIEEIMIAYNFIKTHTVLSKKENELRDIITEINNNINKFMKTHKFFDTLGQFYIEFLRYANSDKGLGIVLTPPHITKLFTELAEINKDSIVLDNCTGTGGFLISAMDMMIKDAGGDETKELDIKKKQLLGIEFSDKIFSLVCSNMYIHGDGRSNLLHGSCFDDKNIQKVKQFNPNVGFLNPPYKTNKDDIEELEFVINNLEQLSKGSLCISIIPMLNATDTKGSKYELKKKILENHTLEAVFSMPNELFHNSNVAVTTCIMIIRAKEKHLENYKTYFGYWKEDGFIKIKNTGRIDYYKTWEKIKEKWIINYKNKEEIPGYSIKKHVTAKDEWCAEAYMETDYSKLNIHDFIKNIKKYLTYQFNKPNNNMIIKNTSKIKGEIKLNTVKWEYFNLDCDDNSVFYIKKGKRLTKKDQSDGNTPYVSSSSLNNGIDNYIGNGVTDNNCITFACYGSIGEVFYQPDEVWASDNTNVFYLRNRELTPSIAMFLITILKLEQFRFSYGMTGKKERLQYLKIKLPIDDNGNINYNFMEEYIDILPYSSNL